VVGAVGGEHLVGQCADGVRRRVALYPRQLDNGQALGAVRRLLLRLLIANGHAR
jgi:hypothetical protein